MVALIGIAPTPRLFGATNPMLSIELNALGEGAFVPAAYRRDSLVAGLLCGLQHDQQRLRGTHEPVSRPHQGLFSAYHCATIW